MISEDKTSILEIAEKYKAKKGFSFWLCKCF